MKLEDDTTHFCCIGCDKVKLVEKGHVTKIAYSVCDRDTQKKFFYRPHWVMLCDKCFKGEGENKDD